MMFRRERYATTRRGRICVTVVMVTVEKTDRIVKVREVGQSEDVLARRSASFAGT